MEWLTVKGSSGDWSWHAPFFPNGWSPCVLDFLSSDETTVYYIQANAKDRFVQGDDSYLDFEDAKAAAIILTLNQPDFDIDKRPIEYCEGCVKYNGLCPRCKALEYKKSLV